MLFEKVKDKVGPLLDEASKKISKDYDVSSLLSKIIGT